MLILTGEQINGWVTTGCQKWQHQDLCPTYYGKHENQEGMDSHLFITQDTHTHTDAGQSCKFKSNEWQQFLDIFASNQYFINNHKAVVDFVDISFTLTLEQ